MEKIVRIGETDVRMKCTAATPRMYRMLFGTDIFRDIISIQGLEKAGNGSTESQLAGIGSGTDAMNQIAYAMAKQADPGIPEFDAWLDGFGMTDILAAAGEILELWGANMITGVQSKKKPDE